MPLQNVTTSHDINVYHYDTNDHITMTCMSSKIIQLNAREGNILPKAMMLIVAI